MHRQDGAPGSLQHASILQGALELREDADLAGHGHGQAGGQGGHQSLDQGQVVHKEGPVPALPGNPLGAAQVEVDGIASLLDKLCRPEERGWVVRTELSKQWPAQNHGLHE